MIHVTDTHPFAWLLSGSPRLSLAARRAFEDTEARLVIPSIVLVEIKYLHARGRITVDLDAAHGYVASAANCADHQEHRYHRQRPHSHRLVIRWPRCSTPRAAFSTAAIRISAAIKALFATRSPNFSPRHDPGRLRIPMLSTTGITSGAGSRPRIATGH